MRIICLTIAAFALTACASTGGGKLAVCDGKHLRPANAYGSVLAPTATGQAPIAPAPAGEAEPRKLSSAAPSPSFGSCA